jgi:hypothetical protein
VAICDIVQRCDFPRAEALEELWWVEATEATSHNVEVDGRKDCARFVEDDCTSSAAALEVAFELSL